MHIKRPSRSTLLITFATLFLSCLAIGSQAVRQYNELDKELNLTYQKVLTIMRDGEDRRLFVEAQRSWIKFRDAEVAFNSRYFPGSKGGLFVGTAMTEERVKGMKSLLTNSAKQEHEDPFGER